MADKDGKKKKKKKSIFPIVMIVLGVLLIGFSLWKILSTFMDYKKSNDLYEKVAENYIKTPVISLGENSEEPTIEWYQMLEVDFDGLLQENSDVIGWIFFENEDISYPILYSGDDDFYLRRSMDKNSATAGSIFLEGQNKPDFSDNHSIVYGHNMRNLSMFGKLKYYREQEDYYETHQYFQIHTKGRIYRYQVFAYKEIDPNSDIYQVPFNDPVQFRSFIDNYLFAGSLRNTGVEVSEDQRVVTLSTCALTDKSRFVVHGVLVDTYDR